MNTLNVSVSIVYFNDSRLNVSSILSANEFMLSLYYKFINFISRINCITQFHNDIISASITATDVIRNW